MYLNEKEFQALIKASMHTFTGDKQVARKRGFYGGGPIELEEHKKGLQNGHLVEIALCHLLGIVQRYIKYTFNVVITKELDMEGHDLQIETKDYGTKNVQIKHTYRVGAREFVSGTYVVSTIRSGSELIKHFMNFYGLPITARDNMDIRKMYIELDYIWALYMLDINEDYSNKY